MVGDLPLAIAGGVLGGSLTVMVMFRETAVPSAVVPLTSIVSVSAPSPNSSPATVGLLVSSA